MKTILKYMRPQLKKMTWGLLIKFIGTIMELLIPWILAYMIDNVISKKDIKEIYLWGFFMIVCAIIGAIANIYANRNASAVGRDVAYNIRCDLYEKVNMLSSKQIDYFKVPSLISRLTTDTNNIYRTICVMQRLGVRAPILLIGGIIITLTLDWVLTLILILIMPFIAFFIYFISKKGVSLYMNLQKSIDNLIRVIRENITGVRIIKSLDKSDYERNRFDDANKKVSQDDTTANMIMSLNQPVVNILFNFGLVLVVVIGAYRVKSEKIQVGVIVAFLSYFTIILTAMKSVTKLFILYFKANASAIRISEILQIKENLDIEKWDLEENESSSKQDEILSKKDLKLAEIDNLEKSSKYHIQFKNVTFGYNKNIETIKNISFELKRGESLGIIGPIGCGKTTIMLLLMGFYKADKGKILIDGIDIQKIPKSRLRNMFGSVFQNDYLFSKTIYENIDLERNLPEKNIIEATKHAQAFEFIQNKKNNFNEKISKSKDNLSGGQKQRVFLSRAFASKPQILILDYATSALDFKTDRLLRESLKTIYKETTKILIDSRISFIKDSTKILVLEKGNVVGYSNHENLLKNCDVYFQMNKIQNGDL